MAAQVSIMSSAGVSTPIILNPVLKTTTIQVTASSGGGGTSAFVQFTLDDPTVQTVTWANLSSAIVSSVADPGGVIYTVLSPLGGLRLSSSATITGTVTLKSIQSVTG